MTATGAFTEVVRTPQGGDDPDSPIVRALCADENDQLWLGGNFGLMQFPRRHRRSTRPRARPGPVSAIVDKPGRGCGDRGRSHSPSTQGNAPRRSRALDGQPTDLSSPDRQDRYGWAPQECGSTNVLPSAGSRLRSAEDCSTTRSGPSAPAAWGVTGRDRTRLPIGRREVVQIVSAHHRARVTFDASPASEDDLIIGSHRGRVFHSSPPAVGTPPCGPRQPAMFGGSPPGKTASDRNRALGDPSALFDRPILDPLSSAFWGRGPRGPSGRHLIRRQAGWFHHRRDEESAVTGNAMKAVMGQILG
jgi:hypothetical protein